MDLDHLPGGALVRQGLDDLAGGRESAASLLVLVGAPRLRRLGIPVRLAVELQVEHHLYHHLSRVEPDSAHSRYNALIRTLVSFERAAECVG